MCSASGCFRWPAGQRREQEASAPAPKLAVSLFMSLGADGVERSRKEGVSTCRDVASIGGPVGIPSAGSVSDWESSAPSSSPASLDEDPTEPSSHSPG